MPDPPRLSKRIPELQAVEQPALPARSARYAELRCKTNFSFLEGASHPDELVQTAAARGHSALAITDRNSLAGVVRAHVAAKEVGLKLLIGTECTPGDAPPVVLLATDRKSYGRLTRLLTVGRRRAPKGECLLTFDDIVQHEQGLLACVITSGIGTMLTSALQRYKNVFGDRCYAIAERHLGCNDELQIARLLAASRETGVPLVAANDVHYHVRDRRYLQDVLTAIRHRCEVGQLGHRMFPNSERYIKSIAQMHKLFAQCPEIVERAAEVADRCTFSLDELRYEYPEELGPPGVSSLDYLKKLTWEGARERYPEGVPDRVRELILHEFELIEDLRYEAYFLTVWDLVRFAREKNILCQGRGSAANSVVCFCLGVTSVDPTEIDVLFERFISRARNEAPDIDVDFEHERREEVLQYLYNKYGRDRAGLAATVITYRGRSAAQDVCKALGFSVDRAQQVSQAMGMWETPGVFEERIKECGLNPDAPMTRRLVKLIKEIYGFPRHLSQHVGGMVMTNGPLCEMVPIENAAMTDRTVVQWDKDDLEALGILKVDCLCLGMLTAIRKCFAFIERHYDCSLALETIPGDEDRNSSDPVYDMICRADTVGVFQIESRAQMSMLPRLRPERFYDLVVEVAIVRPGPIQGNMVHPYLKNRERFKRTGELPDYPSEEIKNVLQKTYGVPIFQEQAMRLAVVAGGFSLEEADQLRRAMGKWRKAGLIEAFQKKLIEGIVSNGYSEEFAERLFKQICGFGDYGFPESHAASFARLTWISCWLKCYYPAAYTASILNSLPMGFYAPAQLVADVRRHDVEVRAVDVNHSDWDCTLEKCEVSSPAIAPVMSRAIKDQNLRCDPPTTELPSRKSPLPREKASPTSTSAAAERGDTSNSQHASDTANKTSCGSLTPDESLPCVTEVARGGEGASTQQAPTMASARLRTPGERDENHAIRLGFRMISGIPAAAVETIVASRQFGPFTSFDNFVQRTRLGGAVLKKLSRADVFGSLNMTRRDALWEALPDQSTAPLLEDAEPPKLDVELPEMSPCDSVVADYNTVGLSLRGHPFQFIRPLLEMRNLSKAEELPALPVDRTYRVAGLVIGRQRPQTAKGVTFVTLEDETGSMNLIIWPDVWEKHRSIAEHSRILLVSGKLQRENEVIHVVVDRLEDISHTLGQIKAQSRDFR